MLELQKTNRAEYDKLMDQARSATAAYNRDYGQYDEETINAVDKFRADRGLNYQGTPPGLVDARMVDALRSAYIDKKRGAAK
jgi:hypothetical protein